MALTRSSSTGAPPPPCVHVLDKLNLKGKIQEIRGSSSEIRLILQQVGFRGRSATVSGSECVEVDIFETMRSCACVHVKWCFREIVDSDRADQWSGDERSSQLLSKNAVGDRMSLALKRLSVRRYGSYEMPNDPGFNRNKLSLVDRGFTYAIAHIRGGGDLVRSPTLPPFHSLCFGQVCNSPHAAIISHAVRDGIRTWHDAILHKLRDD